ncbi:replicative DNA helicase [Lacipirellula parvula]|uniref:Replicative DNA helicase n=1 Tax=Lacipirellula parvula TaxID=2650471 RepID=A0A5K7X7H1_9BACT|nr:replicative DNA helicase [Lacipirellula parvula]BBO31797.1 replicative DNA helicase [Lacipirellula parvula]
MAERTWQDRKGSDRGATFTPAAPEVDVFDRKLPQSVEAERAVLGSILLLPEVFDEVALILRATDFYDNANRQLFEHLLAMHDSGQRIDLMLLVERLKTAEIYDAIGGAAYLAEIGRQVPTAAHAEYYAKIVADKALLRSLIHVGMEIQTGAYDPSSDTREMLSKAEEKVFSILETRGTGHVTQISEVLQHSLDRIDARMEHQNTSSGVETGFIDFDQMTGGLQKSELIILAARPSMGKTALAMNMAEHAGLTGVATLFVSLEMAAIELGDRLLCSVARVNGNRLRNGTVSHEERRKLINAAARISQAPLFIDDAPSRTMTEIAANARRLKRSHDLGLIVIDYLQLIDPDNSRDPRQEQVSKISRRLKGLAREMQVPVLCLGQLNRQVESSSSNKPQLSHLRESGAIEQDADIVMFVHREEYYMTNEEDREQVRGQADLLIRKNRSGPVGEVKLTWSHEFTRFENFAAAAYAEFESYGPPPTDF